MYLVVDNAGDVVAEFGSLEELVDDPGLRREIRDSHGPLKLVRVDEYAGSLVSATSYVTATPLPQFLRDRAEE